jgi:hypothetical protein
MERVMGAAVDEALASHVQAMLEHKVFQGSGSKGFHCQAKVTIGRDRYQLSAQAVLIGSRHDPEMQVQQTAEQAKAAVIDLIREGVPAKKFRSGNKGFFSSGKLQIGSGSYQAQVQAVLLNR